MAALPLMPAQNASVDVLVAYASRHGATRGVAERIWAEGIGAVLTPAATVETS